jgi:hypothetical protein
VPRFCRSRDSADTLVLPTRTTREEGWKHAECESTGNPEIREHHDRNTVISRTIVLATAHRRARKRGISAPLSAWRPMVCYHSCSLAGDLRSASRRLSN